MKTRAAVTWKPGAPHSIDSLITHILKRETIDHGVVLMECGGSIRSVVVY